MSQSPSLINALRAVEALFEAPTQSTELTALAIIASDASGIPVERILLRLDLTGLDLRGQNISGLLGADTAYEGAILTDQQRKLFRGAAREKGRKKVRKKIQSLRVQMVSEFIDRYGQLGTLPGAPTNGAKLTQKFLRKVLLAPMLERYADDDVLDSRYINAVIEDLSPWALPSAVVFFRALFLLLGQLRCPVDQTTFSRIMESYYPLMGELVGELLAEFYATEELDFAWVSDAVENVVSIERFRLLASWRPIDVKALEYTLDLLPTVDDRMDCLTLSRFECDSDEAERLAARIATLSWSDSQVVRFLSAPTHPKVRIALFRQLLAQGNESRVSEILVWLARGQRGLGALSLENGLAHITSFDAALALAKKMRATIPGGIDHVMNRHLVSLARTEDDYRRLGEFNEGYRVERRRR